MTKITFASFIFLFAIPPILYSQFSPRIIIDPDVQNPRTLRTGDLDGDGDLDIVATIFDGPIWYENTDGQANFNPPIAIDTGLGQTFSAYIADLDGDGDLDIAAPSFDLGEAYWYENLDGQGNFSASRLISDQFLGPDDLIAADLDGDSDLDIIVNSDGDNILSWFENLDGEGTFGPQQIITTSATNGRSTQATDIDGDGDIDLVSSSSGSTTVNWFENLGGQGVFETHIIAGPACAVEEIAVSDLDGDGDIDVLTATNNEDRVSWHENLDGQGTFGPQQIISSDVIDPVSSINVADLDNDGDPDVLAIGGSLAWFENVDGQGNFGEAHILDVSTLFARTVRAADLDGDGDQDVLAGLLMEDMIAWYENFTVLSVEEQNLQQVQLYPNPVVNSHLFIDTSNLTVVENLIIYDSMGRKIKEYPNPENTIDLSILTPGLYIINLFSSQGRITKKIMVL